MSDGWIWMPYAGHLCVSNKCRFHLNTYVGKFIVSTVGEYYNRDDKMETLGCGKDSYYETMVFKAVKSKHKCCPYEALITKEYEQIRYATAEDAYKGHLKLCNQYSSLTKKEDELK